jgi:hypothetical protein
VLSVEPELEPEPRNLSSALLNGPQIIMHDPIMDRRSATLGKIVRESAEKCEIDHTVKTFFTDQKIFTVEGPRGNGLRLDIWRANYL